MLRSTRLLVSPLLLAALAPAQGGATLLKDINPVLEPTSGGGGGNQFLTVGATTYFTGSDGLSGSQLWKTDGTAAGTVMIKQISVAGNPSIASMAALGSVVYFRGTDDYNGYNTELWRTDGTLSGTWRLKDINPGPDGSSPLGMYAWNGTMWFTADDGVHGRELWRTDGTEAGTVLVRDINVGAGDGVPQSPFLGGLSNAFNFLFFQADSGTTGWEPWRTDGTLAGTALVRDINPGVESSRPGPMTQFGTILFFSADNGTIGSELWQTTGLLASTLLFKEIYPGAAGSNPQWLTVMNGILYFAANDGVNGIELWSSNGNALFTSMLKDINPGVAASQPVPVLANGQLVMTATTAANGRELWRSNGTAAGTVLVKDINPGTSSSVPNGLKVLGSVVVFNADDGVDGEEFWRSDLTSAGTFQVADARPGATSSNPFVMTAVLGSYAICLANDGIHGQELWRTNGTVAGTFLLKDIFARRSHSNPTSFLDSKGLQGVYFAANNGTQGSELWKSDGSNAGTQMILDINPGAAGSAPNLLTMLNGVALFSADDGTRGRELWRSDGTAAGTFLVADINPGAASSNAGTAQVQSATAAAAVLNGILYFAADNGVHGSELWRTDGTAAGTFLVKDINAGALGSNPVKLFALGNLVFMSATEASIGREIWKSDGTTAGTVLLKGDVNPGVADSCFVYHQFWAYGSRLICPLRDPVSGYELWMSDGTAAGTVLIKDINPGTSGSSPQDHVELNGILYFVAYEPGAGQELWRSDGTTAGTFLFKDIQPGTGQAVPNSLHRLGNQIVFFADAGYATGWELWRTDGTVAGTVMVKDINPGHGDSHTFDQDLFCAPPGAQVAVFTASDGIRGDELWRTDGTAAGTVQHADLNPGVYSSQPDRPFLAGSYLFFTADNGTGRELYAMTSMACAIPYGKGCPGTGGLVPQLSATDTPYLGNAAFRNVVRGGLPNSTAILFYGIAPSELALGNGCTLWFDVFQPFFVFVAGTNATGTAVFALPIPNDRSLVGGQAFTMADVVDPNGAYANIVSMTGGVKHVFNAR